MVHNERAYNFPSIDNVESFRDFIEQYNVIFSDYSEWKKVQLSGLNTITDQLALSLARVMKLPAKRVRPLLIYLTHRLVNSTYYPHEVIRLATAVEAFHTFALIHDDITDQATLRRGEPTVEQEFYIKSLQYGEKQAKHVGLNAALYAGDILLWQSTMSMNFLRVPSKTLHVLQDIFYEMEVEVVAGQNDDGFGVRNEKWENLSEERIKNIFSYKSGRYSIQKPMMLGAALAEVEDTTLKQIESIGEDFGIIFQIKDDLLGVFGDEADMGKSASSDILEGKRTLLLYYTYQKTNQQGKRLIERVVGNMNASQEDIQKVRNLIIETGVKDEMEHYCQEGVKTFISGLQAIPNTDPHFLSIFIDLAHYIIDRTK